MNKKWYLNRETIDSEKEILKHALGYYTEWKYQRIHIMR